MTSFDFTWDDSKKSAGGSKAFARKRNNKTSPTKNKLLLQENTNKPPIKKQKNETIVTTTTAAVIIPKKNKKSIVTSNKSNNVGQQQGKLVKRKQKKDKQLAKEAGDNNNAVVSLYNSNNNKTHSLFSEKHKNLYVTTNEHGKSLVEKVFSAGSKFSDLNIHKYLVSNLEKINFLTLTTVQEKCIPVVLSGRNVLVRSQTGSGKTLAYAVPIVDTLQKLQPKLQRSDGVQAIIVVPTRELVVQVQELFNKINTFQWIVVGHLSGGENRNTEKNRLRKGVHILIATPGRLLDHILHTVSFKTTNVKYLVLDEADRLLDMGFKRDIVSIVEELDNSKRHSEYDPIALLKNQSVPEDNTSSKERQTLLLSATLTKGIAELAEFTMKEHVYIDALEETNSKFNINPEHMVIPNTVRQEFLVTFVKHRLFTLASILVSKSRALTSKVFVFMATSHMVDYHYDLFTNYLAKLPVNRGKLKSGGVVLLDDAQSDSDEEDELVLETEFFKLHGNMDQSARKQVFAGFKKAKKGVLLCTDVAARGLDVPSADCIIQYTGPSSDDDYLHRVGRTGRAGASGQAIIFLTHEEQEYLVRLQNHKVFLKKGNNEEYTRHLCDLMEESDHEKAAIALQKRFENAVASDNELYRKACFAYSSWSRFYNTYPSNMREIFDFKKLNLGHYVTSFALRDTPTVVAKVVRGQITKTEAPRLNRKLATHPGDLPPPKKQFAPKRPIKSISLTTSEYASGLEPSKKKKKKKN